MSKAAWQTPPKAIRLANGARLTHGQIIGATNMITPRKFNSSHPMAKLNVGTLPAAPARTITSGEGLARTGAPKDIRDAPVSPGMKRQTAPSASYLHGAPAIDDEKEQPIKTSERAIPPAYGMKSDPLRGEHKDGLGNAILKDASNLGRKA
jgi:hypothetical protein